jgi:lipopolysaccharide export LptBFGC system permease protein LptF
VSRRSPSNERYQKYTGPKGQTRKSAAQAKPTRKEGSTTSTKSKSKSKPSADRAPGGKYYEPDTPEYKYWRRLWWISLAIGLVLVAVSFYIQYYLKGMSWSRTVGLVAITLSYVAIIAAFYIDYRKLRPMRTGKYVYKPTAKPPADKPADKSSDAGDSGDKS